MTERRWIADSWDAGTATLRGGQAHHLARVLRASAGYTAHVVAGTQVWSATAASVSETEVIFTLDALLPEEHALKLTLLLSVFKFDRMEWAIEKATELGVSRIAPVIVRRTEKHLALAAAKRVERWRRIAHESAQQSRRADAPLVDDPLPLAKALQVHTIGQRILLAETEHDRTLRACIEPGAEAVTLAVGPEGGWAGEELPLFHAAGWHSAGLGARILRAETAAIAALAIAASLMQTADA